MKKIIRKLMSLVIPVSVKTDYREEKISTFIQNGRIPWSEGYSEYKTKSITEAINSVEIINSFKTGTLSADYGLWLDERIVEYPWIFSKISEKENTFLDAGSTFNFDFIVENSKIKKKHLSIYTFFPEKNCFIDKRINYIYGDLRDMYFKDEIFDEIVSQSTIEHIHMDNSIYGYNESNTVNERSFEYLKAVTEMLRVLKPGGKLLITFPFGKYEYHGFFQQFDDGMLQKIVDLVNNRGQLQIDYFKYERTGWRFAQRSELSEVKSYNPHTGKGKQDDGAAHCRSVACIEFIKSV